MPTLTQNFFKKCDEEFSDISQEEINALSWTVAQNEIKLNGSIIDEDDKVIYYMKKVHDVYKKHFDELKEYKHNSRVLQKHLENILFNKEKINNPEDFKCNHGGTFVYKLYDKIPLSVRRLDEGYLTKEDVEKALSLAFDESFVSIPDIESVYIDNKYSPLELVVDIYKNVEILKNNISVPYRDYKDGHEHIIMLSVLYNKTNLEKPNVIKKVCEEIGLTYKQLGEAIGVKEQSLRNMTSSGKITEQVEKSLDLLLENNNLKEQLKDCNTLKEVLRNLTK